MRTTLVLAVVLGTVVAGCGGSSGTKSSTPAAKTESAAATKPAATKPASTKPAVTKSTATVPAVLGFATSKNCAKLLQLGATFAQALQASSGNADPGIADEAKALQAMADAAPAEIRGDFKTIANGFGEYAKVWKDSGIAPGATPTPAQIAKLVEAAKKVGTPKMQAAEAHITAWAAKNCGVKTTTTG